MDEIINYVMENPDNTNPNVLRGMLENYVEPSGTIEITENGTVDVAGYASAEVDVAGGVEGLDYLPLEIAIVGGTSSKYIKFFNVFAGTDKNHVTFYDVLTSKEVLSSGYKLFYPQSGNPKVGVICWSVYGPSSAEVSQNVNTNILVINTATGFDNSHSWFAFKPLATDNNASVTFTFAS